MPVRIGYGLSIVCAGILLSASVPVHAAQVLITEEEAKLPPPKGAVAADRRGITRGPKIELIAAPEPIHSPMHLQMKFESLWRRQDRSGFRQSHLSQNPERRCDVAHQIFRAGYRHRYSGCSTAGGRAHVAGGYQGFRRARWHHQFCPEGCALRPMAMPCPFCLTENAANALVCASCARDIAVPPSLIAERNDLVRKCESVREELSRVRGEIESLIRARRRPV